jgi:hypothetical protein
MRDFLDDNNTYDNHKLPQYNFLIDERGHIIENITILKTETLTQDMKRIGYSDFEHYYQKSKCTVIQGITKYINSFNSESIQMVNEYYKKDFEIFGYTML